MKNTTIFRRVRFFNVLVAIIAGLGLSGCTAPKTISITESEGIELVKRSLKDPYSAKFKDVYVGTGGYVCGLVNSKNSFGGYTGYQRFAAAAFDNNKSHVFVDQPIEGDQYAKLFGGWGTDHFYQKTCK